MRLHRYIERRHRLVQHQHLRLKCQRTRNIHPLPLSAAQLMRIAIRQRLVEPNRGQELRHSLSALLFVANVVNPQWFFQGSSNAHAGRQCTVRILEHHLDLTGIAFGLLFIQLGDIL